MEYRTVNPKRMKKGHGRKRPPPIRKLPLPPARAWNWRIMKIEESARVSKAIFAVRPEATPGGKEIYDSILERRQKELTESFASLNSFALDEIQKATLLTCLKILKTNYSKEGLDDLLRYSCGLKKGLKK